jgi:hypothetical protein
VSIHTRPPAVTQPCRVQEWFRGVDARYRTRQVLLLGTHSSNHASWAVCGTAWCASLALVPQVRYQDGKEERIALPETVHWKIFMGSEVSHVGTIARFTCRIALLAANVGKHTRTWTQARFLVFRTITNADVADPVVQVRAFLTHLC